MATRTDINANIMLDLETTSLAANPCIIELSAIHFNFNTGLENSHFSTPISLDSCLAAGLRMDSATLNWLNVEIPDILARAEASPIKLSDALRDFAKWCQQCHLVERENQKKLGEESKDVELILWGNGVIADNKWIEAAFHAVRLQHLMPWQYHGHHCVRTFVKQVAWITGVDYARTVKMRGRKHASLDDCRHQVRYLVLARRAVSCGERGEMPDPNGELPCEIAEGLLVAEEVEREKGAKEEDEKNFIVTAEDELSEISQADTPDGFGVQKLAGETERDVDELSEISQADTPDGFGVQKLAGETERDDDELSEISEADTESHFDLQELTEKAERHHRDELKEMAKDREEKTACKLQDEEAALRTHNEATENVEKAQLLPEPKKEFGNRRGAAVRTGLGFGLITPESSFSDPPVYEDFTSTQDTVDQNLVSTQDTVREGYENLTFTQGTEFDDDSVFVSSHDAEKNANERKGEANRTRDSSMNKRKRVDEDAVRPRLISPEASFSG